MPNIDHAVSGYIRLRDMKKEMEARHKEELAPIKDKMNKLEVWLLKQLQDQGADNIKTPHGTTYLSRRVSVRAEDKQAFMDYIKEQDMFGLLEVRPSKEAVTEFMESTGDLPPGITTTTDLTANVRR